MLKRTPLRRVSKKRARDMRIYSAKRKVFLEARPVCEVWLRENRWSQFDFDWYCPRYHRKSPTMPGGVDVAPADHLFSLGAPRSTEVHHREKRGKNYLNEATWMAVSAEAHRRIHENPSWARANGLLV